MYSNNVYDDAESSVSTTPKTDENRYENISMKTIPPRGETNPRRSGAAMTRLHLCMWASVVMATIFMAVACVVTVVYAGHTRDCNNQDAEARLEVFSQTIVNLTNKMTTLQNVITDLRSSGENQSETLGFWCYRVVKTPVLTWHQAQQACHDMGGYLAETSDELSVYFTTKHIFEHNSRMWLGATDLDQEGSWKWVTSGKSVESSNWAPGEPSNDGGVGDCMEIGFATDGQWNDRPCDSDPAGYVCQKDDVICDGWLRGYRFV